MVYKSFGSSVKSEIIPNQQLTNKLHKPSIRKFDERNVYSSYIVDMQLISII